jgi:hypothetical protein
VAAVVDADEAEGGGVSDCGGVEDLGAVSAKRRPDAVATEEEVIADLVHDLTVQIATTAHRRSLAVLRRAVARVLADPVVEPTDIGALHPATEPGVDDLGHGLLTLERGDGLTVTYVDAEGELDGVTADDLDLTDAQRDVLAARVDTMADRV